MAHAWKADKPLIFFCGQAMLSSESTVEVKRGVSAILLDNCSRLVDVEAADVAVKADKVRELAAIGHQNIGQLNDTVAGALGAAAVAVGHDVSDAINAYVCGEPRMVGAEIGVRRLDSAPLSPSPPTSPFLNTLILTFLNTLILTFLNTLILTSLNTLILTFLNTLILT